MGGTEHGILTRSKPTQLVHFNESLDTPLRKLISATNTCELILQSLKWVTTGEVWDVIWDIESLTLWLSSFLSTMVCYRTCITVDAALIQLSTLGTRPWDTWSPTNSQPHSQPKGNSPTLSVRAPWPQRSGCVEATLSTKSKQSWGPQTGQSPPPGCVLSFCPWKSQTKLVRGDNPGRA